ncbi:MAG: enoyl-CoA hydratase-related protein [Thermoanaerobaculia bacterium]
MSDAGATCANRIHRELLDDGQLLHVTLDLGKGNIIDLAAIVELRSLAQEHLGATGLKAIVLDHAGSHFSFGAAVEDHLPGQVEEMLPQFHCLAKELLAIDRPILAVVNGQCLGAGLEIALLADRIFSSPSARFGQPEIKLGVFAPLASLLLPQRIGKHKAVELLLSGNSINAGKARRLGLVDELAIDPLAAALHWGRENLLAKSATAIRLATHAGRLGWSRRFSRDLDRLEQLYLGELMSTHDAVEGITAFLERRDPVWQQG